MPKKSQSILLLLIILIVGVITVVGIFLIKNTRERIVAESEVKQAAVNYIPMDKQLVHGEVRGKISDMKDTDEKVVTFCLTSRGSIIQKGDEQFIDCAKKDIKQVPLNADGSFSLRLLPGDYYVTMHTQTTGNKFPAKIPVKAGEIATITLTQ